MKARYLWALTAFLGLMMTSRALGQFTITINVDENGHGLLTNTNGFSSSLPFSIAPDPGPGGLANAATYGLLSPPGLTAGDLILLDPTFSGVSDIIRFNPTQNNGSLVFYSENDGNSLADTGFPTALYPNNISDIETVSAGHSGFTYTPVTGQPGFVAGASGPTTYIIQSDVPEPGSLAVMGIVLGLGLRRKSRRLGTEKRLP